MDIFDSVDNAKPSGDVFDAVATGPAPKPKGLLATVGDTFKGAGARMAQGVNESLGSIDRAFGMDDGAKIYQENAEYWKQKAEEAGSNGLAAKIYTGIGEAPAGVAEFMGNVPYAMAKGAAEGYREYGLTGAVSKGALEGVKRLGVGKVFHGIENTGISGMTKASAMGGTMGAQTAAEQYGATGTINPEDVAASTATGAFLSLDGGGKAAEVKRNLLREGVQSDIAQDLSSRTPMTLATARERLQKNKVEIPDTGITDDSVSVDDAIKSANAAVDWTHDERNRLLKELGGEVEEPAKVEPVQDEVKKGSLDIVNPADALADPIRREIESAQLTAGPFTDYPISRPLVLPDEAQPSGKDIIGVEGYRQKDVEPNKPILSPENQAVYDTFTKNPTPVNRDAWEEVQRNLADPHLADMMADGRAQIEPEVIPPEAPKPVPETDQLTLPATEKVKQLPYMGEAAKVPETKEIADAQISPVAGIPESVDTQVSPEKAAMESYKGAERARDQIAEITGEKVANDIYDKVDQRLIDTDGPARAEIMGPGGRGKVFYDAMQNELATHLSDLQAQAKDPNSLVGRQLQQKRSAQNQRLIDLMAKSDKQDANELADILEQKRVSPEHHQRIAEALDNGDHEAVLDAMHEAAAKSPDKLRLAPPPKVEAPAPVGEKAEPAQFSVAKDKTDTPEFKRWFGDSKVIDKDGKPMTVYHGTETQFNKVNFKKGAQGLFWFTSDRESILNGDSGAQSSSKVMELYAKIENPAGWKEYDKYSVDELEHLGYDGVILPNKDGSFDGFVFKDPSQIKSATKNKGSFDPNNPDIRYSVGNSDATITPEVLSKVTDVLVKALPDKVDLRIVPHIDYSGPGMDEAFAQHGVKSGKVEGLHQAVLTNGELRSIITLAMDGATERTGYHEILHAAESLRLIKSKDLAILERAYPTKDGVDASERRADAFADYVSKKEQPANSLIRAMFDRIISYANRLKSAFNGEGCRTADDVFNDLMGGKLKGNAEDAKPSGPQFAVAGDIPEETKGEKFWRTVQDRYNRVEVLQNFLKEKGVRLSELADVSRGLSVMNGKIADQLKRFLDNRIAPLVKEAGRNKLRLPDIEDFLLMQHAQESNAAMRKLHKDPDATAFGVTDAEAQAKLAAYQARPDFAQLEKTANKFRDFSDETANMLQNAGIISPEMRQAWDNAYQHYVPVRGGEDNIGTGKGVRVNGKQQRRSGHDKRQEHVIENIVKAREFAVKAIEKNKVALSVAQLIKEAGDDRIGTVGKPEKRRVFSNKAMYTVLHKGEPIAAFDSIEAADKFTAMDKRDGGKLSDYQVRISSDPTVSWATSPTLGDNEINAFVNGHQVRIQINDEIAARALTNGGIEQLATLFKAGKSINNYLSRAYTGYDPRFTIRNTARDFTAGMINLTGDYGAKTAAKIALNYPVAMKEFIKGRKDPANSQWVDRYRKAGGSTGASWLPSIERLGEDIQSMYHEQIGAVATYQKVFQDQIDAGASPMKASIKAATQSGIAGFHKTPVLGHFLKMVEMMNAVSENAFRVATFKTLVEEGKSEAEAGEAAKSSTINFDKKGEWGAQIGALYLFFNPAVQGVRRTGKALFQSEHKFQAQAMAGSMALAGYMAAEAARSMWSDDEWDKIPRSVKNRNLVVRTGEKTQITIPIPYEYGTFVGVGYAVNDMVHGKADKRTGLNLAGTLMDAISVIGNPVTDKGDIQPLQMMPTLAKLILAPTMNLNNFGGEIQPTKRDSSPKPDSQNMYRNTKGSYYDRAAAKMNELTGGTKYSSGAVDVSPEVLKFYTRSILGGSFTFLDQVLGLGTMTAQGIKPDVGEVPMVNVLARENTVRDTRSVFYEIANDANKALAEYNAAKKGKAFDVAKELKEQNADLIAVAHIAKTQAKLAKAKRDAADAIRLDDNLSLAEKRERMKALEAKEEIIYNRLISKFNSRD